MLGPIQRRFRVAKLTDQIFNGPSRRSGSAFHAPALARESARVAPGPDLARLLRKHPIERSHTMIAATAFAVVALVVVAFLNRIP